MGKLLRWVCAAILVAASVWELGKSDPGVSPILLGLILFVLGVLTGLRMGSNSALDFVRDQTRVNKLLTDQNNELSEINLEYMKEISSQIESDPDLPGGND